jgi:DNA-binding transcriptional ArsR family regulator
MDGQPGPLSSADAAEYAAWFRALAEPMRVRILNVLACAERPLRVGEIVAAVEVGQSTVSEHLKVLAATGFVLGERRGTASLYRINADCITALPAAAESVMGAIASPSARSPKGREGSGGVGRSA